MTIANINAQKCQIGDIATLAHLNDGSLKNNLQLFLLTCQVNSLSPRTIDDYSQKIGYFVAFCETQEIRSPREVHANHIRLFLLGIQQRCKPRSARGYYGTVCRFFNWLVEEGTIKESPMKRMKPPKIPRDIIKPFSPDDINRLLTCCDDRFSGMRNRAIILTFLDTGLRLSELSNIQLADVDMDREVIKVMGKGAKERVVRIGKETQKVVLKYVLQRNDNLPCLWLTEERKPLQARGIQQMIERLGKRAGVKNVRCSPHTFRHTFAILCLRNSMGEFALQHLLGHSTLTQTRRYTSSLESDDAIKAHREASPVDHLKLRPGGRG